MENARGMTECVMIQSDIEDKNKRVYKDGFRMLGNQYFRYINDDDVELIRVVKTKNASTVSILDGDGEVSEMNTTYIQDNYELLSPDGLLTIAVADMGLNSNGHTVEDVVVCVYRRNEMELGDYSPYVVCRQNITDFFANYLCRGEENLMCGVSVSKTSCPDNIDWEDIRACNDIRDSIAINFYIEDNVDSIIAMVRSNKMKVYNRVLQSCYDEHVKVFNTPQNNARKLAGLPIDGYCTTLEELLRVNNFQYDLDSAYNILAIDCVIDEVKEKEVDNELFVDYYKLPDIIVEQLCKIFKQNITETIVVEYTHEISLEQLAGTKYFILRDANNRLYIINYITRGEYRETDLELIAAKVEMNRVKNLFGANMVDKSKM